MDLIKKSKEKGKKRERMKDQRNKLPKKKY